MQPTSDRVDGLLVRLRDVFFRPVRVFEQLARVPLWAGALLVSLTVATLAQAAFMRSAVGSAAVVDARIASYDRMKDRITKEQYDRAVNDAIRSSSTIWYEVPLRNVVSATSWMLVSSTIFYAIFNGLFGAGFAKFGNVFAVVSHSWIILVSGRVLVHGLNYLNASTTSTTSALVLLPFDLDEVSIVGAFFEQVDLVSVWWTVVVAVGLAVLYKRPIKPVAACFLLFYFGVATLRALGEVRVGPFGGHG